MTAESFFIAEVVGGHRPPLQGKTFAHDSRGEVQIGVAMREGEKSSFELRRRKVNPALETRSEIPGEFFLVTALRAGQIDDRIRREEKAKH